MALGTLAKVMYFSTHTTSQMSRAHVILISFEHIFTLELCNKTIAEVELNREQYISIPSSIKLRSLVWLRRIP